MTDPPSEPSAAVEEALAREAAAIARRYRIDEGSALAALREGLCDPTVVRAVEAEVSRGRGRGAALRRLAKQARRRIYHDLRRYTADTGGAERLRRELEKRIDIGDPEAIRESTHRLLESHASTRERFGSYDALQRIVSEAAGRPRSIVDVGCGLHPLSYPFDDPVAAPEVYLALDRDAHAVGAVATFARALEGPKLIAERVDLERVDWEGMAARARVERFDLAYLLKLIPVVRRRQPAALARIAEVPAEILVVSGSKEALTRHQDISRREEHSIQQFIEELSPAEVTRGETEDEIVYVVRR